MNLFDIVNRKDRALVVPSGSVASSTYKSINGARRAVILEPKTTIRLLNAHEFYALKAHPKDLGWRVVSKSLVTPSDLTVNLIDVETDRLLAQLGHYRTHLFKRFAPVELNWPSELDASKPFHLEIRSGPRQTIVEVGAAFNSRAEILPRLRGKGVEIGPGLNPHVMPSDTVHPLYVETSTIEEWIALYVKEDRPVPEKVTSLKDRYIIGDAHRLDQIEDESLDFIFSNHVVEHLCNPLEVFENWLKKLKPGGLLTGVIPDCRYTFDLRQQPSSQDMWLEEKRLGGFEPKMEHYLRWCKYTQPKNTPEDLIRRKYSIHVHYYTPDTFRQMVGQLEKETKLRSVMFSDSQNNKDFGFVLEKT